MTDKILIVIVLYKITLEESLTFSSLRQINTGGERLDLFVYDNSPLKQSYNLKQDGFNITYIQDIENAGISKAYNKAAVYASDKNKKFLLLLDQDSYLPESFLNIAYTSIKNHPDVQLFAPILKQGSVILSPCKFKFMKGSSFSALQSGRRTLRGVSIFNSGILVRIEAFEKVGGYNELIKLDFSDHYFINHFKKQYNEFFILPIVVRHEFSSQSMDEKVVLNRFRQYCDGVRTYGALENKRMLLFFWTALRALKLTFQFRSFEFLKVLMLNILRTKNS